jgi:putative sigma-54 modulation protein
MNLHVTFKNCEPSDALRERLEQKLDKLAKYFREPSEAHVVLGVEKHRHRGDITVHAPGEILKTEVETDDMYVTVDRLMERLERAAKRQKERRTGHHEDEAEPVDGFGVNEPT